jgi:hypothetical protein
MINSILKRAVIGQPEPTVGMGCTFLSHTDRNPGTIREVFKVGERTIIKTTRDAYRRKSADSTEMIFESIDNGRVDYFRREKSGFWVHVSQNPTSKRWNRASPRGLRIGERDHYYDPHF